MPGPPPKRSEERRRRNEPTIKPTKVDLTEPADPELDPDSLPFKIRQPIAIPEHDGVFLLEEGAVDEETGKPNPQAPWHPITQQIWDSFSLSGQALYWQPSDWAIATFVCETIDRELQPQIIGYESYVNDEGQETKTAIWGEAPIKGATISSIMKAAAALMLLEGDRRRLGLELTSRYLDQGPKPEPTEEEVAQARKGLFALPPAQEA